MPPACAEVRALIPSTFQALQPANCNASTPSPHICPIFSCTVHTVLPPPTPCAPVPTHLCEPAWLKHGGHQDDVCCCIDLVRKRLTVHHTQPAGSHTQQKSYGLTKHRRHSQQQQRLGKQMLTDNGHTFAFNVFVACERDRRTDSVVQPQPAANHVQPTGHTQTADHMPTTKLSLPPPLPPCHLMSLWSLNCCSAMALKSPSQWPLPSSTNWAPFSRHL